jgi:DNA polymerase I
MPGLDDVELTLVNSMHEVSNLHRWLGERRPKHGLGIDLETSGLDKRRDIIRLAQIGDGQHGWAIPWDNWSGVLRDVVKVWDGDWIFHNGINFDIPFLRREGVELPQHKVHDTMVMARINEPHMPMALKSQTARHIDAAAGSLQAELSGSGFTWATVPIEYEPYWLYGALDPVLAYKLFEHHYPIVQAEAPKAYDLERSVIWITQRMERYGAHVDRVFADAKLKEFRGLCLELKAWSVSHYGVEPGSKEGVLGVLKDAGFNIIKQTKSGATSLDAEVLEEIDHPLAEAVLSYRRMQKMASTYLRFYVEEADDDDLLHPSINTLGARTSRMSMDSPNLQNLPRHGTTKAGDMVRNCITTRYENGSLVLCDFDQIEARILAHYAQEGAMIEAFRSGKDFFTVLARQIFDDPQIHKKDPRRQITKNATYATLYGSGIRKFALTAGISEDTARSFMQKWKLLYPGVARLTNDLINTAVQRQKETGDAFVRSPFTGRKYVADSGKEYALVNYVTQGGAAELFKMKLVELDAAGLGEFMVAPVHDEIILDVPFDHVAEVKQVLSQTMNDDKLLAVPLTASVSRGQRWSEKADWTEVDDETYRISRV